MYLFECVVLWGLAVNGRNRIYTLWNQDRICPWECGDGAGIKGSRGRLALSYIFLLTAFPGTPHTCRMFVLGGIAPDFTTPMLVQSATLDIIFSNRRRCCWKQDLAYCTKCSEIENTDSSICLVLSYSLHVSLRPSSWHQKSGRLSQICRMTALSRWCAGKLSV